ncbi:MAG: ABC transporter permease [Roseitalea sp.]|uniref:ABC transporter permease n=1 Tax=Oceaniradius stylonematis TaxID=2184161 RepID=UPI001B12C6E3|nr:ABC transporter permease [Oceaniradius stylonematis]MBO6554133.1 ABC transporter permease [Roseitalea sp.]MBO6953177.1 ABC transporter permease [Rhizobiaceae bacterium]MBO6593524.1 ABC transporter permease [Roseitalea sp.]MBO6600920.1 ABC transporter permease [Roseitalea sp.]MBO6612601.1 ABC transporter permease [Roseitalea sp.]
MAILRANLALTFKRLLRQPGFWVPTILFPAMLYAFFGAQNAGGGIAAVYAAASFAVYAVLGVAFFQFGVSIAEDRQSAFAVWQRSLPARPFASWTARLCAALVFSIAAVALVLATARLVGDLHIDAATQARLLAVCLILAVPATFMGTALGYLASRHSVVAVANLIFLPMAYLGGLWVPPPALPPQIDAISRWTPTRHMGEAAWAAVDGRSIPHTSVAALLVFTLGFFALTWLAYSRDRHARFG